MQCFNFYTAQLCQIFCGYKFAFKLLKINLTQEAYVADWWSLIELDMQYIIVGTKNHHASAFAALIFIINF